MITTAYNAEAHIRAAVQSVLDQRDVTFEHVIVDDGSSDTTADVVRQVGDTRVRLLSPGRIGRARALNLAIGTSSADYLAILDADDRARPDRFAVELGVMRERPDLAAIGSGQILLKEDEAPVWGPLPEQPQICRVAGELLYYNPLSHSSVLFRRRALEAVGGYDEHREALFDWDLYIRLAAAGASLARISTPLVAKRIHHQQFFEGRQPLRYALQCFHLQCRARATLKRSRFALPAFVGLLAYRSLSRPARMFVRRCLMDRQ